MSFLDNTGVQNLVNDLKAKTDAAYQETLVSGTNIKTVNGNSLLGSGDLEIGGGGGTDTLDEVVISCGTISEGGWLPLSNVLLNNTANGTIGLTETAISVNTSVTYEFTIAWKPAKTPATNQIVNIYRETSATGTNTNVVMALYQAIANSAACTTAIALKKSASKWLRFRASLGEAEMQDLTIRVRQLTKI